MLTTRSIIFVIVTVAVFSVIASLVSLLWIGETQSTLGRDSYGTHTEGYRAVHDLISTLGFETERVLVPELPQSYFDTSYVLWNPRDQYLQTEPVYLKELSKWVHQGGHLVVTPTAKDKDSNNTECRSCSKENCSTCKSVSLFDELGLEGISVEEVAERPGAELSSQFDDSEAPTFPESVQKILEIKKRPTATFEISCEGTWDYLQAQTHRIQIPIDHVCQLNIGKREPIAVITAKGLAEDKEAGILAAQFPLGKGHITVCSNPFLASNVNLIGADNCVLLTHLMTSLRHKVVFDEFYHGLTIRGNALWLLSKRPYATLTVCIVLLVGMWVWRNAVFLGPCRDKSPSSRRTLAEYLEAMSRFLLKSRESSKYILSELREGVLWHYCRTLGLPPQQHDLSVVLGLLSRRSPKKATQLKNAIQYADGVLNNPRARNQEVLLATRKVSDCLST